MFRFVKLFFFSLSFVVSQSASAEDLPLPETVNCSPYGIYWAFPSFPLGGARFTTSSQTGDPLTSLTPISGDPRVKQAIYDLANSCDGVDIFTHKVPEGTVDSFRVKIWLAPIHNPKDINGELTFVSTQDAYANASSNGLRFSFGLQMPGVPVGMVAGNKAWLIGTIMVREGLMSWRDEWTLDPESFEPSPGQQMWVIGNLFVPPQYDGSKFDGNLSVAGLNDPSGYLYYFLEGDNGVVYLQGHTGGYREFQGGGGLIYQGCRISSISERLSNISPSELSSSEPDSITRTSKIALKPIEISCNGADPSLFVQALSDPNDFVDPSSSEYSVVSKNISASESAAQGDIGIELTVEGNYKACSSATGSRICETEMIKGLAKDQTAQFNFFANYIKFGPTPIGPGDVEAKFYLTINYN